MGNKNTQPQGERPDLVNKMMNSRARFVDRLKKPTQSIPAWDEVGAVATHKMAMGEDNGKYYVYPDVQDIDGELHDFTDPFNGHGKWDSFDHAMETDNYIEFDNEQDAQWLANENYKKFFPKGEQYQDKQQWVYDRWLRRRAKKEEPKLKKFDTGGPVGDQPQGYVELPEVSVGVPQAYIDAQRRRFRESDEYMQYQADSTQYEAARRDLARADSLVNRYREVAKVHLPEYIENYTRLQEELAANERETDADVRNRQRYDIITNSNRAVSNVEHMVPIQNEALDAVRPLVDNRYIQADTNFSQDLAMVPDIDYHNYNDSSVREAILQANYMPSLRLKDAPVPPGEPEVDVVPVPYRPESVYYLKRRGNGQLVDVNGTPIMHAEDSGQFDQWRTGISLPDTNTETNRRYVPLEEVDDDVWQHRGHMPMRYESTTLQKKKYGGKIKSYDPGGEVGQPLITDWGQGNIPVLGGGQQQYTMPPQSAGAYTESDKRAYYDMQYSDDPEQRRLFIKLNRDKKRQDDFNRLALIAGGGSLAAPLLPAMIGSTAAAMPAITSGAGYAANTMRSGVNLVKGGYQALKAAHPTAIASANAGITSAFAGSALNNAPKIADELKEAYGPDGSFSSKVHSTSGAILEGSMLLPVVGPSIKMLRAGASAVGKGYTKLNKIITEKFSPQYWKDIENVLFQDRTINNVNYSTIDRFYNTIADGTNNFLELSREEQLAVLNLKKKIEEYNNLAERYPVSGGPIIPRHGPHSRKSKSGPRVGNVTADNPYSDSYRNPQVAQENPTKKGAAGLTKDVAETKNITSDEIDRYRSYGLRLTEDGQIMASNGVDSKIVSLGSNKLTGEVISVKDGNGVKVNLIQQVSDNEYLAKRLGKKGYYEIKPNTNANGDIKLPSEAINALDGNIRSIQELIPGTRVFGGHLNARNGFPHVTSDLDAFILEEDYIKNVVGKFSKVDDVAESTITHKVFNVDGKAGHVDFNIIRADKNGNATGRFAEELFMYQYPDKYAEWVRGGAKGSLPINARQLLSEVDLNTKSVADMFLSGAKHKHTLKPQAMLEYGDIRLFKKGLEKAMDVAVGPSRLKAPQFAASEFADINRNKKILSDIGYSFNVDRVASSPERMQAALDDWYYSNTTHSKWLNANDKGVSIRDIDKAMYGNMWDRKYSGGNGVGAGLNGVFAGDSQYGGDVFANAQVRNSAGVKAGQFGASTPEEMIGVVKKEVHANMPLSKEQLAELEKIGFRGIIDKGYTNLSQIASDTDYFSTIFMINGESVDGVEAWKKAGKLLGFKGLASNNKYGKSDYFGLIGDRIETIESLNYFEHHNAQVLNGTHVRNYAGEGVRASAAARYKNVPPKSKISILENVLSNNDIISKMYARDQLFHETVIAYNTKRGHSIFNREMPNQLYHIGKKYNLKSGNYNAVDEGMIYAKKKELIDYQQGSVMKIDAEIDNAHKKELAARDNLWRAKTVRDVSAAATGVGAIGIGAVKGLEWLNGRYARAIIDEYVDDKSKLKDWVPSNESKYKYNTYYQYARAWALGRTPEYMSGKFLEVVKEIQDKTGWSDKEIKEYYTKNPTLRMEMLRRAGIINDKVRMNKKGGN